MNNQLGKIKFLCRLKEFTQEQLAEATNLDLRTLKRILSGASHLTEERGEQIANVFQITYKQLINFDEKEIFEKCIHNIKADKIEDVQIKFENLIKQYEKHILSLEYTIELQKKIIENM